MTWACGLDEVFRHISQESISNCEEQYRQGETISTEFVELTSNLGFE
jgi:hypothetical protein